jgi:hypothetical protein
VKKAIAVVLLVVVAALWLGNGYRAQQQVGSQDTTVQAQLTSVARVVPTPTP